jgi:hypothetical protein
MELGAVEGEGVVGDRANDWWRRLEWVGEEAYMIKNGGGGWGVRWCEKEVEVEERG